MNATAPPRLAVALLRLATAEEDRESLIADLEQEFADRSGDLSRARRWYWHQTIRSLAPVLRRRWELRPASKHRRSPMTHRSIWLSGVLSDLRYAWRLTRRAPVVTVSIIAAVSMGIAATTAMVSVMEGLFLRPLPFPEPQNLVRLGSRLERFGQVPEVNYLDSVDWWRQTTTVESIAAYDVSPTSARLAPDAPALSTTVLSAGETLDRVLGIHAVVGRWFAPSEQIFGAPGVVMLSHRFWTSQFGADPDVIGRHLELGGNDQTIVGVLPESAERFPAGGADFWTPLTFSADSFLNQRGSIALGAVARRKPAFSLNAVQSDLAAISATLARMYPDTNRTRMATVDSLQTAMVGPIRPMLLTLGGAIALLLAIACLNIANLLLAHAHARAREFAVRAAIGASRGRLVRQLWTENLALFSIAGGLGVAMAGPLARMMVARYPGALPLASDIQIDARVIAAACLVTIVAMLLAAAPQVWRLRRSPAGDELGGGQRIGLSRSYRRLMSAFVIVQVALSMVLLVGGALLLRTFMNLTAIDPGFVADDVVTMRVSLPSVTHETPAAMVRFQDHVAEIAGTLPGVQRAAHAMFIPFAPGAWGDAYALPGGPPPGPGSPMAHFYMVSPDYLETMGVPLLRGRGIASSDRASAAPVLVVSETFARHAFPGSDALGQRISWNDDTWEIVGVARDVRHDTFWGSPDADAYVPRAQVPRSSTWLLVKTHQAATVVAAALYDRLKSEAPALALTDVSLMTARLTSTMAPERFRALLTGTISLLSLLLAVVGLYGVVAYGVARQTREIGLRMALGARTTAVLWRVLAETARTVAFGLLPGVLGAFALARWLATQHVVQASIAGVIAVALLTFSGAALLAAAAPAIRASRVNPVEALRED